MSKQYRVNREAIVTAPTDSGLQVGQWVYIAEYNKEDDTYFVVDEDGEEYELIELEFETI